MRLHAAPIPNVRPMNTPMRVPMVPIPSDHLKVINQIITHTKNNVFIMQMHTITTNKIYEMKETHTHKHARATKILQKKDT